MRQRRLFLIRFFAANAAIFFLSVNLFFPQPTYAFFSSLDTPAGAEIAAYEASTVAASSVGASSTASAIISETGATTFGDFAGPAFIGLSVTGLAIAFTQEELPVEGYVTNHRITTAYPGGLANDGN